MPDTSDERSMAFTLRKCCVAILAVMLCSLTFPPPAKAGQQSGATGLGDWLTLSSNLDGGFRTTQFFEPDHNVALFQWDSRLELWLPPFRHGLS